MKKTWIDIRFPASLFKSAPFERVNNFPTHVVL